MKKNLRKNKKYPLVTVITPTYNRAPFLGETILSVLNQDYPNIEYIVLDGESTDNTLEVVKKFRGKIIWDSHKNMGEQWAVNKGFSMAKGEIIGVVNSDDPLLPGAISEIVNFMVANPKIIGVYPDWVKIDKDGREIEKVTLPDYSYEYMLRQHSCTPGPATFYRKIIIDKLKGRDECFKYVSDFDFVLRAGLTGKFARIPKFLATFRIHPGAATTKNKGFVMAMEHVSLLNKIFSLPNLPSNIKKNKNEAYDKACEAARICRGNNLDTKVLISLISLYYSPVPYLKKFIRHRLEKLAKITKF
ncbi:MAG: glycosyltransferase [Patescibacteria group bacterium]|nr:glycosyltransferase [Actinomycetota bacterium]MCL5438476.1 glycosyltransferase [Patescibacteria group bacterium]